MIWIISIISYIILITIIYILIHKNRVYKDRITGCINSAILKPEDIEGFGREIALNHEVLPKSRSCSKILPKMEDNYKNIIKTYKELTADIMGQESVIPAAEWLFDNFYVLEEQVKEIRINFPKGYYAVLPCLANGILKGYPRIYAVILDLVFHIDGRIDEKVLVDFIKSYQSKSVLSSGELWAAPIMLRIALIEDIKQICEDILKSQEERKEADRLADIILASGDDQSKLVSNIKAFTKDMSVLSSSFTEQFLKRIRRHGVELGPVMHYIDERLASQDTTSEEIIQIEHQDQAKKQVSMGNCITSLRLISALDWSEIFELLSPVEQVLKTDPSNIYGDMDFSSRDYYRHIVEDIARSMGISEAQVARKAIECTEEFQDSDDMRLKHVGYYLAGNGRKKLESVLGNRPSFGKKIVKFMKKYPSSVYLWPILALTSALTYASVYYAVSQSHSKYLLAFVLIALVVIIPISELAIGVVNWLITHTLLPSFLPKLELRDGIPEEHTSMVVIPTLLPDKSRAGELLKELEVYYLANQEDNLYFSLLGDFTDANDKDIPGDDEIIKFTLYGIDLLNKKYAHGGSDIFYFFHRYRKFNPSQRKWMGWERKRGKLMEFNELLRGSQGTTYFIKSGDVSKIPKVKYIITLDADTQLPRNTARKLIGTIAHPLNSAVLDEERRRVIQGYGILQPRISIGIINANKSSFSKIFAGQGGIDPYTTAVSDIYQDLFGEGIYTGKGIYDIDVFIKVLNGNIPENTVLSHDLLEGSYTRAGLVTDIELVDGFPSKYSSYSARMHRWIRGDWQLIPWLKHRLKNCHGEKVKNPLSLINKWKILDNLRRSLISISLVILIFLTFSVLPGNALVWLSIIAVTIAFPIFSDMADVIFTKGRSENRSVSILTGIQDIIFQIIIMFIFLPYRAYLVLDAVIKTLIRLYVTQKNMLEWETAADAETRLKNDLESYFIRMWISMAAGILLLIVSMKFTPELVFYAVLFSFCWLASPFIAYLVSKPSDINIVKISDKDMFELRLLSRKTWRYFEEFINPQDNYLLPDNFQEEPANGVAHRTSPTNIGLALASTLAARDMGYINTTAMIKQLEYMFESMDKLDTWKGHLYNWYDTVTLQPLRPLYVSTVDSGNLIGYLMTLKYGIEEYMSRPMLDISLVSGLIDTTELLNRDLELEDQERISTDFLYEYLNSSKLNPQAFSQLLTGFKKMRDSMDKNSENSPYNSKLNIMIGHFLTELKETMPWTDFLYTIPDTLKLTQVNCAVTAEEVKILFEKLNSDLSPSGLCRTYRVCMTSINTILEHVPDMQEEILIWLRELKLKIMRAFLTVNQICSRAKILTEKCEYIIKSTSFKPLFDEKRQLFSIGYSAEDERLNRSYYDLLASEARQTSFIAISKGDIDQKHWFRLGRSVTFLGKYRGLVSWSGTMFEYLMPLLIMKSYKNTLLDNTYHFVLKSQITYGRMRNVPWGVSESGFYGFDISFNYQYKAFGVPRLGLKRGLVNDLVVAPYATILALMVDPASAIKNIETLKAINLEGPYGFYEAVDYTPERMSKGGSSMIVRSYMAHHHGMSMLALDNFINDNTMQQRFHNDPYVRATELLLQEKVPNKVILTKDIEDEISPIEKTEHKGEEYIREIKSPVTDFPEAHIISNGTYYTVLTNSGSGYSKSGDTQVTRWRGDQALQGNGMFIYIQNINSNNVWSSSYEPYKVIPEQYRAIFSSDKVEYLRVDGSIDTHTEIVISPEDNTEVRRVSLTNHSDHTRVLEVTSYFEVVMSTQAADTAHTVFNNLFVKTEFVPGLNSLLSARRPRTRDEKHMWLTHSVIVEGATVGVIQYETDRLKFIGRGRSVSNPQAADVDHPLSNTVGSVLDPIMSLRRRVKIQPGETVRVSYITGISDTKDGAIGLASKYNDTAAVKRAFELAWTRSQVEARYLNLQSRDIELYQRMVPHILYISPLRKSQEQIIKKNTRGQSGLWPYGISGDVPIVLVTLSKSDELDILPQLLKAHEYWRSKGFSVDLVILNEDIGSYYQDFHNKLKNIILSSHAADIQDRPGGVFLRQSNIMTEEGKYLLFSTARIVIRGDGGSIWQQLRTKEDDIKLPPVKGYQATPHIYPPVEVSMDNLLFFNGLGGFKQDGSEYVIRLRGSKNTPAPWSNVICNENFGFLVTESGLGYTWAENSRENKLTPWSNDPVIDPAGEAIYFRDEEDGEIWTTTPLPIRENEFYTIRHGFGYTTFEHISHGIKQEMTVFVPKDENVKIVKVKLNNISGRKRRVSAFYYIRPVLGVSDQITAPFIITDINEKTGILFIRNTYTDDFTGRIAFMDCSIKERSVTGDRNEFFGKNGSLGSPEALKRETLSGWVGAGHDPCGAIMASFDIENNDEKVISFTLGQVIYAEDAVSTALKYRDISEVEKALDVVKESWSKRLSTVQVKTPNASLNILMNGWLLYQTICCRLWARTAFYQSGGAYGFRDQLQDVMAALYTSPELTKDQLLISSSHQFIEGDVQHWWHPITDKGIRTKFSDDLLWLPYVTVDYIQVTKDTDILDSVTPYLEDEPLKDKEDERYNKPRISTATGTLYEHCLKAIDRSLKFGIHGIPLMGSGDWNDGMNTVGNKGLGESIWLGWLIYSILIKFAPLCRLKGDSERADRYVNTAKDIVDSIEKNGWDGSWYRRAYFDDGTPLGSTCNTECQIDSIAQSWSIISGGGRPKRSIEAMGALEQYLIRRDTGIIMLLTPPFDKSILEPGYIKGYVPGVRENGGQYTHAAVWVIMAFAILGNGDRAMELYDMINPINHTSTAIEYSRYRVEPYVVAADVYAVEPYTGRGGWTWYTGAAGWMYRVCADYMLGLKIRGDELVIDPCISCRWTEYTIKYRYKNTLYIIDIKNPSGVNQGVVSTQMDGRILNDNKIPLTDDGREHQINIIMG